MEWLNIHSSTLDSPEMIGAEPTDRATWLFLARYCAGQENGGRIAGCREWGDRRWQQAVRVTLEEVNRQTELWEWDGDDLAVRFYPIEKEAEIQAKRAAGKLTVAKRWAKQPCSPNSSAIRSADTEGKEREGKEREEEGEGAQPELAGFAPPADLVVMTFPTAGKQTTWELRQSFVDELTRLFPNVAITAEADKALAKITRGIVAKKTARGMEKFLMTWMERTQNSARPNGSTNAPHQPNSRTFAQKQSYADFDYSGT